MQTLSQFIRHLPPESVQAYFEHYQVQIHDIDLQGNVVSHVANAINHLKRPERVLIYSGIERIGQMIDELGQKALLDCVADTDSYASRLSTYDISVWAFLDEPDAFRRAEGIRYSDHYRQGRMWSGFSVPSDTRIDCNDETKAHFEAAIKAHFNTGRRVLAEIFKRKRHNNAIYQLTLYREELLNSELVFDDNNCIKEKKWHPVSTSAITYDPKTGALDVVSESRDVRELLAKLFTNTFLQSAATGTHPLLRSYHLDKLLSSCHFDTEPEDGIQDVLITEIELQEYGVKRSMCFKIGVKDEETIHAITSDWFAERTPFNTRFYVKKAKFAIRFERGPKERCSRVLPFTLSYPNGCNLKSRTEREQLIDDKYLSQWGLVSEVA